MKPLNPTLRPGDTGPAIANLQEALDLFGFRTEGTERNEFRFGRMTQQVLLAFQKEFGLDQSGELDQPTAQQLNQLLNEKSLLNYRVNGRVLNARGEPLPKQTILVFDVDLRGAGIYRTTQKVVDLTQNQSGFQPLGKRTITNSDGFYSVTFDYNQYNSAEKGLADVVVFVIEGERITGRSRMSTNRDYTNGLDLLEWNIILAETRLRGLSEFDRIQKDIAPMLKASQLQWSELADSGDQLQFLADETEYTTGRLAVMVRAAQRAHEQELPEPAHELLFGIGRQDIALEWAALAVLTTESLWAAIKKSIEQNIINEQKEEAIRDFLNKLASVAVRNILRQPVSTASESPTLEKTLSFALRSQNQQLAFLEADRIFTGTAQQFWNDYLPGLDEFREQPETIEALKLTNQLAILTNSHLPLIEELQVHQGIKTTKDLIKLTGDDWQEIIGKAGLPDGITDKKAYGNQLKNLVNAAYPTERIGLMIQQNELTFRNASISVGIQRFLSKVPDFQISSSRIDDFDGNLKDVAGEHHEAVRDELLTIQRLYQLSPSPEILARLKETGLRSAYEISSIPEQTFLREYADKLGSMELAKAVYDRATYQTARLEHATVTLQETLYGLEPAATTLAANRPSVEAAIANQLPTYQALLGSADLCECQHCQSIYSASAYFVDLLRLLSRSRVPGRSHTALDVLLSRRPDLAHLPLTCENTDTLIPYIDLVNEIMEYYVVHDQLDSGAAHDIAGAIAPELRATPQYILTEAYRKLAEQAVYPTSLPYHQPLDSIRTFLKHWQLSRADLMTTFGLTNSDDSGRHALTAERLGLSEKEYAILTDQQFDGAGGGHPAWEYYGFSDQVTLLREGVKVQETIRRLAIPYVDLVELVKTRFLNPFHTYLDYLEDLFKDSGLSAFALYQQLIQIQTGALQSVAVPDLQTALERKGIQPDNFDAWVVSNFLKVQAVVTLFEPESRCNLETTQIRTIRSVAEKLPDAGVDAIFFKAMHQFVRLQRKLGYSIHDFDNLLTALEFDGFSPERLDILSEVIRVNSVLKLPLPQLAVLWGKIDIYGPKSLYAKLFLNKSVPRIDPVFQPDAAGNLLANAGILLQDHLTAVLAALRISAADFGLIIQHLGIDAENLPLTIDHLSVLYRYAILARTLKLSISELTTLITVFSINPFSRWDGNSFVAIDLAKTAQFVELVADVKASGLKIPVLAYILTGIADANTAPPLTQERILTAMRTIRNGLQTIDQTYPQNEPVPLTEAILQSRLALVFPVEVARQTVGMLTGSNRYSTLTEPNLTINLPQDVATRVRYIRASGRLQVQGVLTEADYKVLKALPGASAEFSRAVDAIYNQPERFLQETYSAVFADPTVANREFLNHPAQDVEPTTEGKLDNFYQQFLPFLTKKLRQNLVMEQLAVLTGLDTTTARYLLIGQADTLADISTQTGLSAAYFNDTNWTTHGITRTDATIDFTREAGSPDPAIPADAFSVQWSGYISPFVTAEYTFTVEVAGTDETVRLWIGDLLLVDKPAGNVQLSWQGLITLPADKFTAIRLDYSDPTQTAGVRLYWQTDQAPREIVPTPVLYPASLVAEFTAKSVLVHRAALLVNSLSLSGTDVYQLIAVRDQFSDLDFLALNPTHYRRLRSFVALRTQFGPNPAMLSMFLAEAARTLPESLPLLLTRLSQATGWDEPILTAITSHFGFTVENLQNEVALTQLYRALQIVRKTGASVALLGNLGSGISNFDALAEQAQAIKNTLKTRLSEEDWQTTAGTLHDKIRENQKQALIAWLLQQQPLRDWGVTDADSLYEYFLIDVQMTASMDTSRMVQATAAVQQFVNRCYLNLENRLDTDGLQTGVPPETIDTGRWVWMKNYRVWEANRKVFTYPENWLEPEWRDDKTEFFQELESDLLQNDINDRSVETALRSYLRKLADVANLRLCGMFQDEKTGVLHVFARNHTDPPTYYYRNCDKYRHWSGWSKVSVAIPAVKSDADLSTAGKSAANETPQSARLDLNLTIANAPNNEAENGNSNGVHLAPVVWKNRLLLFWPEFFEKQAENADSANTSVEGLAKATPNAMKSTPYWEARMAWSELRDGKWTAKQLTDEFIRVYEQPSGCSVILSLNQTDSNYPLSIYLIGNNENLIAHFTFTNIEAKPRVDYPFWYIFIPPTSGIPYRNAFMAKRRDSSLQLRGNEYLKTNRDHRLLHSPHIQDFETLKYPFFYFDNTRAYFVIPTDISYMIDRIRRPDLNYYIPLEKLKEKIAIPRLLPSPDYLRKGLNEPVINPEIDVVRDFLDRTLLRDGHAQEVTENRAFQGIAVRMNSNVIPGLPGVGSFSVQTHAMTAAAGLLAPASIIGGAFSGIESNRMDIYRDFVYTLKHDKGLTFRPFYHPFAGAFISRLNQQGVAGLLDADTNPVQFADDSGALFQKDYLPNTDRGYVQMPFPKENIDFDEYGPYSLYNHELFFHAPLFIATRLSKNGQFADAMRWFHYIFDPTTNEQPDPANPNARYWKVKPFRTANTDSIEDFFRSLRPNESGPENVRVAEWRDFPFKPHRIAKGRLSAYMKNVVLKYVENLTAWGDDLFRRETRESITEATQLYVMAAHILGPKPQFVPKRGTTQSETFASLRTKLDDFGNALVQMENLFPFSSSIPAPGTLYSGSMLGVGSTLYFGIPHNEKMLKSWDTVGDRLFKIRHCLNIDGVELKLALFEPPIDPGLLVAALAKGLSIGSVLSDLNSTAPLYRFAVLMQKANEFVAEVKNMGSGLLAAIEKRDAEEMARKRATHETVLLTMTREIKARQVLEAKAQKAGLQRNRETQIQRFRYYGNLLGLDSNQTTVPDSPLDLPATLNEDSDVFYSNIIPEVLVDLKDDVSDSGETGVKLIPKEQEELNKLEVAKWFQAGSNIGETLAAVFNVIPSVEVMGAPLGVGVKSKVFYGFTWGAAVSALAKASAGTATFIGAEANQAAKMASYIRRAQEWTMQANQASREIMQIDKQLLAADIRIQITRRELAQHDQQISHTAEMELFLRDKYTNQELYQWLKEQLFSTYKQSYQLALDLARQVEKAYQFELGRTNTNFIKPGYWDSTHDGLTAGESLQLSLRQLEKSYLDENRRELELTRHISVVQLNPVALITLRQTGSCELSLPEELFDFDFAGHYFRRIKAVSLTIPCVAGPYTTVNATLRLMSNSIRIDTTDGDSGYQHNQEEGVLLDDARFVTSSIPFSAVAICSAQNDSGVFELNFRDDRYLPFEGAGAISTWKLELNGKHRVGDEIVDISQFDYDSITDVILHLRYTAREDTGLFRQRVVRYMQDVLSQTNQQLPLIRMFSLRQEFPSEWHRFMHPANGQSQTMSFDLRGRFPFFTVNRKILINRIELVAASSLESIGVIRLGFEPENDSNSLDSLSLTPHAPYNNLLRVVPDLEDSAKEPNVWTLTYRNTDGQPVYLLSDQLDDLIILVEYSAQ